MEKKDKTILPCIDYHDLDDFTVKNRDLPLLFSTAIELLHGTKMLTKLDLCIAYHLVRVRGGDE